MGAIANVEVREEAAARQPTVVFSPHPILLAQDREVVYAAFLPNETIVEFLARAGLLQRMGGQPFALTVDGSRLPRTLWAHCRPKPGTLINLYAIVRGGDGQKKNPLATVAMIAIAIFAPQYGAYIASSTGLSAAAGAAIGVAFTVAGGMVVNGKFAPPRPGTTVLFRPAQLS